ncbi:MAG: dephospho-CoA kinase [Anaerolineaceae bacterium]|nr:dephospho-CoA kinase [Anaerolineaceae bacterium]
MNRLLIGLTGNIATGKSVVRRMLVNHGALGLDADLIAHRTQYPGGKAYQAIINTFGPEILTPEKEISRAKLGEIVFANPERLLALEGLVHPAVTADIKERIEQATLPIVVIEAIKLLETPLAGLCQSIWISQASPEHQMERLLHARHMSEDLARQRIEAQPPQSEKRRKANVVINTESDFRQTWQQVHQALNDTIQSEGVLPTPYINIDQKISVYPAGAVPLKELEAFWQDHSGQQPEALFVQLAFNVMQVLMVQDQIAGMLKCEDWNFTSSLNEILLAKDASISSNNILEAFRIAATERQAELLILSNQVAAQLAAEISLESVGFSQQAAHDLSFPAWQQALLRQSDSKTEQLWVRTLTQDLE